MAWSESTTSSTSHTLTGFPMPASKPLTSSDFPPIPNPNRPVAMDQLRSSLSTHNRTAYIVPTTDVARKGLLCAKSLLDRLAPRLIEEQQAQLQRRRRKRKRGEVDRHDQALLRLSKLHLDGFETEQVWAQATKMIQSLRRDVELRADEMTKSSGTSEEVESMSQPLSQEEAGFGSGEDEQVEQPALEDSDLGSGTDVDEMEEMEEIEDMDEILSGDETGMADDDDMVDLDNNAPSRTYVEDPNKLNDGFFSIDDFNKQSEFLERQDAAADLFTGEASDEEDIDWDADPMAIPTTRTKSQTKRQLSEDALPAASDAEEDFSEDDEAGPTFDDVDAESISGDEAVSLDGVGDNTNDIMYRDFFEPPARKLDRSQQQEQYLKRQSQKKPPKDSSGSAPKDDMKTAMADVRRDLFDDESEHSESDNALSDVDPDDPKVRRSAHARRQAKLAAEIRKLEAASIAKREWTLAGEAKAADRPLNSLLEEDLDFERTGKPVPVITAEVSEDIEALIKRRILAQQFDEVIRRRPDADSMAGRPRRGRVELDDSRAQQSLAEIYEEEHVKNSNPDTYVNKTDASVRQEEQAIEVLWKDLSATLDALCSWHYKPKPPAPSLTIVGDIATIAMEDAQPATANAINGAGSMLAPQEIYSAGQEKGSQAKGEVVPRGAAPVAIAEMTREQKLRRRRREKERLRKQEAKPISKKAQERRDTMGALKQGGVKLIGRKGDILNVEGGKITAKQGVRGAGGLKL